MSGRYSGRGHCRNTWVCQRALLPPGRQAAVDLTWVNDGRTRAV